MALCKLHVLPYVLYSSKSDFSAKKILCCRHSNHNTESDFSAKKILCCGLSDDFKLYVTMDRFYKANATLPMKTQTDFI